MIWYVYWSISNFNYKVLLANHLEQLDRYHACIVCADCAHGSPCHNCILVASALVVTSHVAAQQTL